MKHHQLRQMPTTQQGPRPTVASVLGGRGGRFRHISEPLGRREAAGAANLAAVVAVPEEVSMCCACCCCCCAMHGLPAALLC